MTVLEIIKRSTDFPARKGVDSPRLQTELLLAHLLGLPRMKLYLNFERALVASEVEAFRGLIQRRGQREPLQYLVGSTSFCGLEIALNQHVLIPRPETELLAERGWQFLSQLSTTNSQLSTALDFGAGSGCIAIAMAIKSPGAQVYALEICSDAIVVARQNAERHGVMERIEFFEGDGFAVLPEALAFDLIISNPPYIPTAEIESLQPEVRDHEPRRALDGGVDGLDYFRRLAAEAAPFLKASGSLMLEFGDSQAEAIRDIFQHEKWIVEAIHEDYTRRPRILVAKRPGSRETDTDGQR